MSIAVFAGSFDPFTVGHLDIVKRAAPHFEKFYVTVSPNPGKGSAMFSWEERIELIESAVKGIDNVIVTGFTGLLVDHCHEVGADVLIRSIRNGSDVDYERQLETVNRQVDPSIETMYVLARSEYAYISSTLVRELIGIGIDISRMVPEMHPIILNKINNINN
ncbi:MAG: pantetheine-phosphate adenylyltransferase [Clostridia bacterium]|nr:pantetheine-phosphate adenylyltransferase [Clostridia bacterium]